MKRIPVFPLTDAKVEGYALGTLTLVKPKGHKKRFFVETKPRGSKIKPQRRAYYRSRYVRINAPELPELADSVDNFYRTKFPGSYRGPNIVTTGRDKAVATAAPRIQTPRKSNAKGSRRRCRTLGETLAYKRGHNAATRDWKAKYNTLSQELRVTQARYQALSKSRTAQVPDFQEPEVGVMDKVAGFFGRLGFN